jgi:hypothetical protein
MKRLDNTRISPHFDHQGKRLSHGTKKRKREGASKKRSEDQSSQKRSLPNFWRNSPPKTGNHRRLRGNCYPMAAKHCDGTHSKVGFDGAETAGEEAYLNQPKEIDGPTLKLIDTEKLCASARFCHRAGGIWNLVPKSDDPETKQITIEEACDCPSGRLVVTDKQAKKIIEANLKNPLG